jgi:hypothetical protein
MPPHQRASNEEEELAQESSEEEEEEISKSTAEQKQQEGDSSNREKGDPLSLLANVSSDMVDPGDKQGDTKSRKQQKKNIKGSTSSKALPTSPLQRRPQPHPIITPKGRIGGAQQQQHRPPPQPQQHGPPQHSDSQPITPTIGYYQPYYEQPHQQDYHPGPPPPGQYPGPPPPYAQGGYPPPPQQQQQQQQQQYYRGNAEWEAHPGFSPAVVERGSGSFDSSDGSPEYHDRRPYYDYRGPPDSGDYSQPPPQRQQQPPPQHWQRMAPPPDGPGRPYPQPRYSYQGYPQQLSSPYPPPIPPPAFAPPRDDHERPTGKHAPSSRIRTTTASTTAAPFSPYSYVQQPRLEDKTMLRKKFSWKHFPEVCGDCVPSFRSCYCFCCDSSLDLTLWCLAFRCSLSLQLERFLIENRDEYLRHSSKNYTAEQKQYNNRLTEELLEVAEEHHYVFDPEDFNFVAIRDRIRCYYKSYVQTARKRGLQVAAISPSKKQKVKKESRGTDTEADIEAEEKDDVVIDKGTDTEADIEAEEKDDVVIDKGTDTEADIEAEEKDDVVIDKETDGKQSDEKNEDNRKIGEKKAEATAEKKIDETGAGEELDTADAKEVLKEGVGKAA